MLTSFTKAETYYRRDFTNPELKQRVKLDPPDRRLTIDEEDLFMGPNRQAVDIDDLFSRNRQPPPPPEPRPASPIVLIAQPLTQRLIVQDGNGNNVDVYQARAQGRGNIQVVDNEDEADDVVEVRRQPLAAPRPQGRVVPRPAVEVRKTNAERQKKYVETQQADSQLKREYLAKRRAIDEKKTVKKMLLELNAGSKEWNKTQSATKIKYELKLANGKYISGKYPELS